MRMIPELWLLLACLFLPARADQNVTRIANRLELFVDDSLIERLEGTRLVLHHPQPAGVAFRFDKPWEGAFCAYATVIREPGLFRMYYRGLPAAQGTNAVEATCYAESPDGITWTKPELNLFEIDGSRANNVILANMRPFSANFSPFLDTRPGAPLTERFKALAGNDKSGLVAFVSKDGKRWKKLRQEPVITKGVFDSQNVVFWSQAENCYVSYFRTWTGGLYKGYRTISRATSTNFTDWSDPVQMTFGSAPLEHLYTSQVHPYYRAPHIYIATPMRFVPKKTALTAEQAESLGIVKGYANDTTDVVLMSSRGGERFMRTFMEGFIRPGPDPGNWASRAGLTVLGIVPTGPSEMSIYKQAHYAQDSAHVIRYTLRTDGFVSVNAPHSGGEMRTRPLSFSGREMILNFATSAVGSVRVEIQDAAGAPIPGFALADAREELGDSIERTVHWKQGSDVSALAGKPVRLRFVLKDCDLYSIRFRQ